MNSKEFLKIGIQFISITQHYLKKNVEHKNAFFILSDFPIDSKEFEEQGNETFKYSDFESFIAVFFCFYHGLELIIKTFVQENKKIQNHNLEKLLTIFKEQNPIEQELYIILSKYIILNQLPSFLKDFFIENESNPSKFYEILKYPTSKKGQNFNYHKIEYRGDDIIGEVENIINDIISIRRKSVKLCTAIYDKNI